MTGGWTVLKFGGELLEEPDRLQLLASVVAAAAVRGPLAVVHGGGREIDAALARAGIPKRQVDGVRVTDGPTLNVVIEVLAGAVNTRFVAAITAAGGRAVGLTGADAGLVRVEPAPPHTGLDGATTALGLVGVPSGTEPPRLVLDLGARGYIPVVASLGLGPAGAIYNVNADVLAADLAARLSALRLVIAGATPGVLDAQGRTIPRLGRADVAALVGSGVASAGMVAKLRACEQALAGGTREVVLVDGRDPAVLAGVLGAAGELPAASTTRMVA